MNGLAAALTHWITVPTEPIMRRAASITQYCAEDLKQGRNVYDRELGKLSTPNHHGKAIGLRHEKLCKRSSARPSEKQILDRSAAA